MHSITLVTVMALTYEEISKEALELPPGSKVLLAEQLIESIGAPERQRIEALWAEEIERRLQEFDEGKVQAIPGEEVFRRIRARARK